MGDITICDDNEVALVRMERLVRDYLAQNPYLDWSVRCFDSGFELMGAIEAGRLADVYLLDVLMPGCSGIELGEAIRQTGRESEIIYLSSSREYALAAYRVQACQYLVKPIDRASLFSALDRALNAAHCAAPRFALRTKNGLVAIGFHRILVMEYRNHRVQVSLNDSTVLTTVQTRSSFAEICAPLLRDERFLCPHNAFVINFDYVQSLDKNGFRMANGAFVPISRRNYAIGKSRYLEWLARGAPPARW